MYLYALDELLGVCLFDDVFVFAFILQHFVKGLLDILLSCEADHLLNVFAAGHGILDGEVLNFGPLVLQLLHFCFKFGLQHGVVLHPEAEDLLFQITFLIVNGMLLIEFIDVLFEVLGREEFVNHSFVYSLFEVIEEVLLVKRLHLGEDLRAEGVEVDLTSLCSFFWLDF